MSSCLLGKQLFGIGELSTSYDQACYNSCMNARVAQLPREALAQFCRRHSVRRMSVFGSVLRDDFRSDSDIDVMLEFEPGKTPGLAFFLLPDELAPIFGRRVDVTTRSAVEAGTNPIRQRSILDSAVEIYAAR